MGQVKKSRKHKRFNAQRTLRQVTQATLKGTAVIYMANNDRKGRLINLKTQVMYSPHAQQAELLLTQQFKWTVYCAVFCRGVGDSAEAGYMKSIEVAVSEPCTHGDLFDTMTEHHLALLHGCNESHLANVGWLASPEGVSIPETLAGDLFKKHGAWDVLAPWQAEKLDQ